MNFLKLVFILLVTTLCSCTSLKKTVYLQDQDSTATSGKMPEFVLTIKPNDILTIQVFTINTEAFPGIASTVDKQQIDNRTPYEKGMIVDNEGFVQLPLIGKIYLSGMTISEARDSITKRFETYMDAPIVVVKKLSFKVTVLGEVNKPGLFYVANEKITLFEALGLAGDLTPFGSRKEVRIVRQTSGDNYKEIMVDLTTKEPLNSEVAFLYPDDVVYIKPLKRRNATSISPTVAIVTSVIATFTLMISVLLREY